MTADALSGLDVVHAARGFHPDIAPTLARLGVVELSGCVGRVFGDALDGVPDR